MDETRARAARAPPPAVVLAPNGRGATGGASLDLGGTEVEPAREKVSGFDESSVAAGGRGDADRAAPAGRGVAPTGALGAAVARPLGVGARAVPITASPRAVHVVTLVAAALGAV